MDLLLDRRDRDDVPADADWIVNELLARDARRAAQLLVMVRTSASGAAFLLIDETHGAAIFTKEIAEWTRSCHVTKYVAGIARGLDYNVLQVDPPAGQQADYYRIKAGNRDQVAPRITALIDKIKSEKADLFKVSHWTARGFRDVIAG